MAGLGLWRSATAILVAAILTSLLAVLAPANVHAAEPDWQGEYFTNTTLSGSPAFVRRDGAIAFDWGTGSPGSGIAADNFSVRWTRSVAFAAGTYRFTTTTDDGVRLYLDNQLVIDKWIPQSATAWHADVELSAGDHAIRMEYFEATGDAVAKLSWLAVVPGSEWQAQYYTNTTLSGSPAITRADIAIDFDWGHGSPASGFPADNFSVRWTRTLTLDAGTYEFTAVTDDGVRVFVDGIAVIDQWVPQSPTQSQGRTTLATGPHTVVVEYFEATGTAVAKLGWAPVPGGSGWHAEYFANGSLTGTPALIRTDPAIDFEWNADSPSPALPADFFSVRWTSTLTLSAGTYTFGTYTDDGVRLYVDGALVIDKWVPQSATYHSANVPLSSGQHTVRMEYFEQTGAATARLTWALPTSDGAIRINAGGGAYVDRHSHLWSADSQFSGGVAASLSQPILNTSDDPLYIDERAGSHQYQIPLSPGNYIVRLHFAELFKVSSGVRQFDVFAEGVKILDRFDIYGEAGHATLVTRTFPVSVADGMLNLTFASLFDNAAIHALEVHPANTGADLAPPAFAGIPQPENESYLELPTVDLSVTDNQALGDAFWRIGNGTATPLFTGSGTTSFATSFTLPQSTFDALPLGSHTLIFGATDQAGNASVTKWRFRKVDELSSGGPISFSQRSLLTASTPGAQLLDNPTTVELGPDGRLYVGQQNGYIHVITLDQDRNVVAVDRIDTIHATQNFNPDGTASSVQGRHLLGITFDPRSTPARPILWAAHSDVRFCFNAPIGECDVDINSGMITRLIGPDFDAGGARADFVTGLPRSREIHAPNAVHFGPDDWLYLTVGSHTNYGAPSTSFSHLAESHLTAAVLRVNVHAAPTGSFPLDVEALDANGGEVPGVFEVYATGLRNAYDFTWHSNGRLYVNVNAGNAGNGNTPGPADGCPDAQAFSPGTLPDFLTVVDRGDYGGHPNPARGECVLNDGTLYPAPLPPDPDYRPPIHEYVNGTSVNGITEYHVPTFGGQLLGNLISASWAGDQSVRRVVLDDTGSNVLFEESLAAMVQPLDVDVGPDGAVYVAEHGGDAVQLLQPVSALRGEWTVEPPLPTAVQEVGVVACAGNVYVIGGIVAADTNTNAVWAYTPESKQWTRVADYPGIAVDHAGAACVNGKVYLVGGLINANNPVSQVLEYSPTTDTWTTRAPLPRARGAMGVAVLHGKIYAAGGLLSATGPVVSDLSAFDPQTNTWASLPPMPTPRDHLIMEAVDGRLYAMGGRNAFINDVLDANEAYDPATSTWEARAPLPVARGGMASAALHGQIQVWGGEGPSGEPTGTFPQGHMYDPATDTWQEIAGQLTPRHGTDAAQIGDRVYVPAGGPQAGGSVTDVHESFSFVSASPPNGCTPSTSPGVDTDGDRYTDIDELDNGTDACSAASRPPDADGDFVSDRNDGDDDNDGVADDADQFQLDPQNGTATELPWVQHWNPGDAPAGGFANSGFTGVQLTSNGVGFLATSVHAGGAGGFLTITPSAGTYRAAANAQDNALQVGFDATQGSSISTRIAEPFSGQGAESGKRGGIFVGLDEDNYLELLLTTDSGTGDTGIVFASEFNGVHALAPGGFIPVALPGPDFVELVLDLDPLGQRVTASYRVDSTDPADRILLTSLTSEQRPALAQLFVNGLGAGVVGSNTTTAPFAVAYDYFRIERATSVPPLSVATTALPNATVGTSYAASLAATGGIAPYAWVVASGSLPPGLSLQSSGAIGGVPSAAGTFSFVVGVTDSAVPAQGATKPMSITVNAPALQISTSGLPTAHVGQTYSSSLAATGGQPPYSWQLISGTLPPGLALSSQGAISGVPTSPGNYSFTVRVTDAGGQATTRSFAIKVRRR